MNTRVRTAIVLAVGVCGLLGCRGDTPRLEVAVHDADGPCQRCQLSEPLEIIATARNATSRPQVLSLDGCLVQQVDLFEEESWAPTGSWSETCEPRDLTLAPGEALTWSKPLEPLALGMRPGLFTLEVTFSTCDQEVLDHGFELVQRQQAPDPTYRPQILEPSWPAGQGARVLVDTTHDNFHTLEGSYRPLGDLLRADGFQVSSLEEGWSPVCAVAPSYDLARALDEAEVLVLANPRRELSPPEADLLVAWVERGGSLLLIADHAPHPSRIMSLAWALGVQWRNDRVSGRIGPAYTRKRRTLLDHPITSGRGPSEQVERVYMGTGSSFELPEDARPIAVFPRGARSLDGRSLRDSARLAALTAGEGRVVLAAEAGFLTSQVSTRGKLVGLGAHPENEQLALNLFRWLGGLL